MSLLGLEFIQRLQRFNIDHLSELSWKWISALGRTFRWDSDAIEGFSKRGENKPGVEVKFWEWNHAGTTQRGTAEREVRWIIERFYCTYNALWGDWHTDAVAALVCRLLLLCVLIAVLVSKVQAVSFVYLFFSLGAFTSQIKSIIIII